ncbi:MAG: hypothetical protein OK454_11850, partial [Thaumarchaeota archaeon]|nr:hypothetical protein [Nitrososphaerota archaeon]
MTADRKVSYYKDTRILRDGQVVDVWRCLMCHAIVSKSSWEDTRSGIRYRFIGVRCGECGS